MFICKNAMIDLMEVLRFEIKKVKKQNVVRFWVKAFLSTHQLNFQGSGGGCACQTLQQGSCGARWKAPWSLARNSS